jgi:hypothetical protein
MTITPAHQLAFYAWNAGIANACADYNARMAELEATPKCAAGHEVKAGQRCLVCGSRRSLRYRDRLKAKRVTA